MPYAGPDAPPPAADALQQHPDIVLEAGAGRGLEINVFQHVLLGVAAAEAPHAAHHRAHQIGGADEIPGAVGAHGLGNRQREVPHDAGKMPRQSEPMGSTLALLGGIFAGDNVKAVYVRGGLAYSRRDMLSSHK